MKPSQNLFLFMHEKKKKKNMVNDKTSFLLVAICEWNEIAFCSQTFPFVDMLPSLLRAYKYNCESQIEGLDTQDEVSSQK